MWDKKSHKLWSIGFLEVEFLHGKVIFKKDGLNLRLQPGFQGDSEVESSAIGKVLGWVTFLALDFQFTLPSMIYLIIGRYLDEPYIFNQPCGKPKGLLLGDIDACHLLRCSPLKRGNNLQGPSHSRDARFRIT